MFTSVRLRYIWCVLAGGMLWMSVFPGSGLVLQGVVSSGVSRWVHFLIYLLVSALPVVSFRRKGTIAFCLGVALVSSTFEFIQVYVSGGLGSTQNAGADYFGVGAGVLLALNIRRMRMSSGKPTHSSAAPSLDLTARHL